MKLRSHIYLPQKKKSNESDLKKKSEVSSLTVNTVPLLFFESSITFVSMRVIQVRGRRVATRILTYFWFV